MIAGSHHRQNSSDSIGTTKRKYLRLSNEPVHETRWIPPGRRVFRDNYTCRPATMLSGSIILAGRRRPDGDGSGKSGRSQKEPEA